MTFNPLDLSGRLILVTGASSGIGRETSIVLSRLNARLILAGRNEANLQATLGQLEGAGHSVAPFDLADVDAIPGWVRTLAETRGALAGLVHSAGVHAAVPLRVLSGGKLEQVLRVNVSAGVMLVRGLRQKGCCIPGASVVFLSSVAGLTGQSGVAAYAASKAAICGATRSLAVELAREGIRVNCIAAGMVMTEMTERFRAALTPEQFSAIEAMHPLGFGAAADVATGAAYLLSPAARWITGSTLVIDGGYTAQ